MRRAVDEAHGPGQFLLTGSAVPADDVERHTGAGRFSFLRLRPMTLQECGAGKGSVSLAALFNAEPVSCADPGQVSLNNQQGLHAVLPAIIWSR